MQENLKRVDNFENWRKQMIFRSCHRGMKEMDLLLGSFADHYIQSFNEDQLEEYEELLSINDPDLYKMYLKQIEPTQEQQSDMLDMFLNFTISHT